MVTIKDIAGKAGVSPTTVSNVIHGYANRVSEETVRRVQKVISEMGYTPNLSARSLVSSSSQIIGIINHLVPDESGGVFQDPFHGALISGIDLALREANYYLMLRTIDTMPELLSFLSNWNLDGLILTGIFPKAYYQGLRQQSCPFVLIDSYIDEAHTLQIRLKDREGGYIATAHLLACGHRDILFCGPPMNTQNGVVYERLAGYRQALAEYGVPFRADFVYEREFGMDETAALGHELAKRDDFTAIFATADVLAAGLLAGLRETGKRIPEDISIVGFDDLNISRMTCPPLTTIHQDVMEKGRMAVKMLLAAIHGEAQPEIITFPVRLVQRRSVGRV